MARDSGPYSSPPPSLESGTNAAVKKHAIWVAKQMELGLMPPATAKELTQIHRTILAGNRQEHQERELEQLRGLVKEAEKAAERRKANQVRDMYGHEPAMDIAYSGKIDLPPDGGDENGQS